MALDRDEPSESFWNYVKEKLKSSLKFIISLLLEIEIEEVDDDQTDIRESERAFCGICFSIKRKSRMFITRMCSSHVSYCNDCVRRHVSFKIKAKKAWVRCPHPSCAQFLTPQECSSVLPRKLLDQWEVVRRRAYVSMRREIRCPFEDCSTLLMVVYAGGGPEVEVANRSSAECVCPSCMRRLCKVCHQPQHDGSECDMDRMFKDLVQRENWRPCPRCHIFVERAAGCCIMRCRCGSKFCYGCGSKWGFLHICRYMD